MNPVAGVGVGSAFSEIDVIHALTFKSNRKGGVEYDVCPQPTAETATTTTMMRDHDKNTFVGYVWYEQKGGFPSKAR